MTFSSVPYARTAHGVVCYYFGVKRNRVMLYMPAVVLDSSGGGVLQITVVTWIWELEGSGVYNTI